jgi:hypothetical protein
MNERLPALAAELVALKPDVIVTAATPPSQAAMRATSSNFNSAAMRIITTLTPNCRLFCLSQRRVDQSIHHPAHHSLGLALARPADVLEDHHRLDAVDHGERPQQPLVGLL